MIDTSQKIFILLSNLPIISKIIISFIVFFIFILLLWFLWFLWKSIYNKKIITFQNNNRTDLRFGLSLGWQLARFELIDGSSFPEVRGESLKIKEDIKIFLLQDGYPNSIDKQNAHAIIHNVLSYYSTSNLDKHTFILIGIAALRTSLIGASENIENNNEMENIAYSAIQEIDPSIPIDKIKFFQILLRKKPNNIVKLLELIDGVVVN
jgi:hypothetical protein